MEEEEKDMVVVLGIVAEVPEDWRASSGALSLPSSGDGGGERSSGASASKIESKSSGAL